MNTLLLTQIILVLAIICNLSLIALLARNNQSVMLRRALLVQMCGICIWTCLIFANLWFESLFIESGIFAAATIALTAQVWFVLLFPHNQIKTISQKVLLSLFTSLGILFTIASFSDGLLFTTIEITTSGYTIVGIGKLFNLYSAFVIGSILLAIIVLFQAWRTLSDTRLKLQAHALCIGFTIFFIITLFTNLLLPGLFDIYFFNAIGPLFSVALIGFIAYTILAHQFLDIVFIIQRGLIYTVLLSCIVLTYATALNVLQAILPFTQIVTETISSIITIIIGILTVPQIDRYLREKTDRFFFKGTYNFRETIHELSDVLQSSLNMDALVHACEAKLATVLRASAVVIATKEYPQKTDWLRIPIKLQNQLIGVIAVGPKNSGEEYSSTDLQLLRTFSNHAATAFSRIFLYQEVKRRAEELEMRVSERTAELKAVQEQQKQMMLQISHNLQTPLAILQNKIDDLKSQLTDQSNLSTLETSLEHVSNFMRGLLRLSRLEGKYEEITVADVNLTAVLEELVDEVNIIATAKGISVRHSIAPNIIYQTDEHKLREIVMNITSNAIKYIGAGREKRIDITVAERDSDIVITVTDTGIGMSTADQEHVFEYFKRGGNNNQLEGTGLGLAITKQLVEQLGGTITLTSTLGAGSTFTITFPK